MEDPQSTDKKTKTLKSRRESAVQGTNDSSIVSKCSMAALGYFDDPFLQCFVSKVTRRAPLIHRGYYVRAKTLDYVLRRFLEQNQGKKQIISLGAGFDSAYFRLQSRNLLNEAVFYEVDFPEVVKRKCALIKANPELLQMLGTVESSLSEKSPLIELSTQSYKLLGVDLSQINILEAVLNLCHVDLEAPTLFLSECVLTYMTRRCASDVIKWAAETYSNSMFVLYEQINPDDAFGLFMQHHFHTVGSPLKSINAFPTLQSQRDRFHKLGWNDVEALDMNQFYFRLLSVEERERVEKIEPLDEYEEWHLKCAHYMVLCGYRGNCARLLTVVTDVPEEICSPSIEINDDIIKYIRKEPSNPFQRFGHATAVCGQTKVVCVGGFGEQNGKHMRVTDITCIDSTTLSVTCVNPDVENFKIQVSRMHATLSNLEDGRVILIGGRLSPMKLCTQVVGLTLKCKPSTGPANLALESKQSTSASNCAESVLDAVKYGNIEDKNCSEMNCGENIMNICENQSDSNSAIPVINVNESSSNDIEDKENKVMNSYLSDKENEPDISIDKTDRNINKCGRNPQNEKGRNPRLVSKDKPFNVRDDTVMIECSVINQEGDVPCPRWRHSAVLHNYKGEETVIIFGGRTQAVWALGDCYRLVTHTAEWSKVESVGERPSPRQSHTASLWNNHMVIAGGLEADLHPLSSVHMLDLTTLTWTLLHTNISPRYSHTAHVIGDLLVLVGGVNCDHSPPGVALVHLPTGVSLEFSIPTQDKDSLVMLHRHTSVAMDTDKIAIFGGGGNCFSFGTHLNSSPFVIDLSKAIEQMEMAIQSHSAIRAICTGQN